MEKCINQTSYNNQDPLIENELNWWVTHLLLRVHDLKRLNTTRFIQRLARGLTATMVRVGTLHTRDYFQVDGLCERWWWKSKVISTLHVQCGRTTSLKGKPAVYHLNTVLHAACSQSMSARIPLRYFCMLIASFIALFILKSQMPQRQTLLWSCIGLSFSSTSSSFTTSTQSTGYICCAFMERVPEVVTTTNPIFWLADRTLIPESCQSTQ